MLRVAALYLENPLYAPLRSRCELDRYPHRAVRTHDEYPAVHDERRTLGRHCGIHRHRTCILDVQYVRLRMASDRNVAELDRLRTQLEFAARLRRLGWRRGR